MPMAPAKHCPAGHPPFTGKRCPSCEARRKALVDGRRPSPTARGYDRKWREARTEFLTVHPRCVVCGGRSNCVDHAVPHKGDAGAFWDRSRWVPMCGPCHSVKTASRDGGFGNPIRLDR